MRLRLTYIIVLCCLSLQGLLAQAYDIKEERKLSDEERVVRGDKLKGFRILSDISLPVRVNVTDTLTYGTHHYMTMENKSLGLAYMGNFNTPWQSKVFFDRPFKSNDFIYLNSYDELLSTPNKVLFYDTKTAFTFINHNTNFDNESEEESSFGTMSLNLGKAINLGLNMNYTSSKGFYNANKSKSFRYRLFGSYRSDRYDLWTYVANDYYKMSENGGLSEKGLDQLKNPDKYSSGRVKTGSHDLETAIANESLFNRIRSGHAFLSHRYKFGYYKLQKKDSDKKDSPYQFAQGDMDSDAKEQRVFIPVANVSHQLYYNKASRRFIATEKNKLWEEIFGKPAVKQKVVDKNGKETFFVLPNDTAQLVTLKNTLALSLLEGFRPWVKFGLSAYVRTENYFVSNPNAQTKAYKDTDKYFSTFVGGELTRFSGKGLNVRAKAEVGVLGEDLGALLFEGDLTSRFSLLRKNFGLKLAGHFENYRPSYFLSHQHNTYGWWDKSFNFSRRLDLSARVNLASWGTWGALHSSSLQNYIYWDKEGKPVQSSDIIQVAMLRLGHQSKIGALAWSIEGAYQQSSSTTAIPLPLFIAKGDIYLDLLVVKVLQIQLGLEGYWHSSYYAPKYNPTNQQFIAQDKMKIGGETPLLNAYANFRLKGVRFYARMFNVGEVLFDNDRLSSYLYPYNPMHIQVGLAVDLDR